MWSCDVWSLLIAEYGDIHYHISNGGNYYIYTDITQFGMDIRSSPGTDLITVAGKLKAAVTDAVTLSHPENGTPAKLTGVFFYSHPLNSLSDNISELCIYEKMVSLFLFKYLFNVFSNLAAWLFTTIFCKLKSKSDIELYILPIIDCFATVFMHIEAWVFVFYK